MKNVWSKKKAGITMLLRNYEVRRRQESQYCEECVEQEGGRNHNTAKNVWSKKVANITVKNMWSKELADITKLCRMCEARRHGSNTRLWCEARRWQE